jgi:hypothetical protein
MPAATDGGNNRWAVRTWPATKPFFVIWHTRSSTYTLLSVQVRLKHAVFEGVCL